VRDIDGVADEPAPAKLRRRYNPKLVALGVIVALSALGWLSSLPRPSPLPAPEEIQSMTARLIEGRDGAGEVQQFQVPPSHFPRLLSALGPSRRDQQRIAWVGLGELDIVCNDGRRIAVAVYRTGQPEGAFSVNPGGQPGQQSNCYRGGSAEEFEAAVRAAAATAGAAVGPERPR
jgi:hypothetical protein